MTINELHASHIRRVKVGFILSGEKLSPAEITESLGIEPDHSANRGDERRGYRGVLIAPHSEGFWRIDTEGKVQSKDINDHLRFLLGRLLPHEEKIVRFVEAGYESFVDVLWESTYLYAGTGPLIESECIVGIGRLKAGMGFDIYQIDEPDEEHNLTEGET